MDYSSAERAETDAFLSNFKQEFITGWIPPPGFGKLPIGKLKGRIPITQPSSIRSWRVGEDVKNLTSGGQVPTWSTIRRRHRKNTAQRFLDGEIQNSKVYKFNERNVSRMKKGLAPQRFNKETIKMDIAKYADYFHDGYVNDISHIGNNISFSLESSVIENLDEIADKHLLSDSNSFKGTLNVNIPLANEESKIELFKKLSICINICNERVFNGRSENFFTEAA